MKSKLSWIAFVPLALAAAFFKLAPRLLFQGSLFGLSSLMTEYLYLGTVVLIFVLCLLFCLTDKKIAKYYLPHINIPAGIVGLGLAFLLAADGANQLMHMINAAKIDVLHLLGALFSMFSAIIFIVFGLNHVIRNREGKRFSLLNIFPALMCAVRMILSFVQFTTISVRLADVASLVCYIFATLFFYHYAVALSLIKTKNSLKFCYIFGMPAVATMIPYGVYQLVFSFDTDVILNNVEPLEILLFGVYIFAFLLELTIFVKKDEDVKIVVEEEPEAAVVREKVEGFLASADTEDEQDEKDIDEDYIDTSEAEGFLYQEIKQDEEEKDPELEKEIESDTQNYLTQINEVDVNDELEDDRPENYESRLDEIDKLILEINEKSD